MIARLRVVRVGLTRLIRCSVGLRFVRVECCYNVLGCLCCKVVGALARVVF